MHVVDEGHPPASESDDKDCADIPRLGTPISNSTFTAYDTWFGRATAGSFRSINPQDETTFENLLQFSRGNPDILQTDGGAEQYAAGRILPCATNDSAHWEWMEQSVDEATSVGGDNVMEEDED